MDEMCDFDVVIAGAGPSGLALAILLGGEGLKVGVVEKSGNSTIENPGYDGREIALTHQSWAILQKIGAAQKIDAAAISRVREAFVLNGPSDYALRFNAQEVGENHLGYMVSNHLIRRALYETAMTCPTLTLLTDHEIVSIKTDVDGIYVATRSLKTIRAQLMIAADSRFSKLRDMMGIKSLRHDYRRHCIVCRVRHEKDLDGRAYEIFGLEKTVAILPLERKEASLVVTLSSVQAENIMKKDDSYFIQSLHEEVDARCGKVELVSERFSYPLIGVYAYKFQDERFALMGDAAVGMHPVTAHGFNLGLSGADTLLQEIQKGLEKHWDLWDRRILMAYERQHRLKSLPVYCGTEALVHLYTRRDPLSLAARQGILHLGNIINPARRMILRSLTDKVL